MSNSESSKPVLNIDDAELMDFGSPSGKFQAKLGRMGPVLGTEKLGAMLTIVEPGKRAFPFHAHHAIEEMFYVIEGEGEYRFGNETHPVKQGDLLGAPCGGPSARIRSSIPGKNRSKISPFRTMDKIDVVEYPDSDKFLAFASEDGSPQTARMRFIGRMTSAVDYFDGEDG